MKTYFPLILAALSLGLSVSLIYNKRTVTTTTASSTISATPASLEKETFQTATNTVSEPPALKSAVGEVTGKPVSLEPETITLTDKNTVTLRSEVDSMSMSALETQLLAKSRQLKNSDTIYLVLDTPGGSVPDGNLFISFAQSLPQKVKTISIFSASMGFHIVQSLDERLVMFPSVLMSHKAAIGQIGGEINGNLNTRVNFLVQQSNMMDAKVAKRIGVSVQDYQKTIDHEYWVFGENAVKQNVADRTVAIKCDASLDGTYVEAVQILMFTIDVTYSKCPAITGPLKFEIRRGEDQRLVYSSDPHQVVEFSNKDESFFKAKKIVETMLFDRQEYARQIMRGFNRNNTSLWTH